MTSCVLLTCQVMGLNILKTLPEWSSAYPTKIHVAPLLLSFPSFLVVIVPALPHSCRFFTNLGTSLPKCLYLVLVSSPIVSMHRLFVAVSVLKHLRKSWYHISFGMLTLFIIAQPRLASVAKPSSTSLFLCGVSFPVYSYSIPSCQSLEFNCS